METTSGNHQHCGGAKEKKVAHPDFNLPCEHNIA
jgi:hypothetical protein